MNTPKDRHTRMFRTWGRFFFRVLRILLVYGLVALAMWYVRKAEAGDTNTEWYTMDHVSWNTKWSSDFPGCFEKDPTATEGGYPVYTNTTTGWILFYSGWNKWQCMYRDASVWGAIGYAQQQTTGGFPDSYSDWIIKEVGSGALSTPVAEGACGDELPPTTTTNNYWTSNVVIAVTNALIVISTNTADILDAILYETEAGNIEVAELLYEILNASRAGGDWTLGVAQAELLLDIEEHLAAGLAVTSAVTVEVDASAGSWGADMKSLATATLGDVQVGVGAAQEIAANTDVIRIGVTNENSFQNAKLAQVEYRLMQITNALVYELEGKDLAKIAQDLWYLADEGGVMVKQHSDSDPWQVEIAGLDIGGGSMSVTIEDPVEVYNFEDDPLWIRGASNWVPDVNVTNSLAVYQDTSDTSRWWKVAQDVEHTPFWAVTGAVWMLNTSMPVHVENDLSVTNVGTGTNVPPVYVPPAFDSNTLESVGHSISQEVAQAVESVNEYTDEIEEHYEDMDWVASVLAVTWPELGENPIIDLRVSDAGALALSEWFGNSQSAWTEFGLYVDMSTWPSVGGYTYVSIFRGVALLAMAVSVIVMLPRAIKWAVP